MHLLHSDRKLINCWKPYFKLNMYIFVRYLTNQDACIFAMLFMNKCRVIVLALKLNNFAEMFWYIKRRFKVPYNYMCKYSLIADLTMHLVSYTSLMLSLLPQAIYSASCSSSAHKSALDPFYWAADFKPAQ